MQLFYEDCKSKEKSLFIQNKCKFFFNIDFLIYDKINYIKH